MPHSMTGFASQAVTDGQREFTWELRSVNHRYLDIGLRLPEEWRRLEADCRALAPRYIKRGKLDCTLRAGTAAAGRPLPQLNPAALEHLLELQTQIRERSAYAPELSVAEILRFEGVIAEPDDSADAERIAASLLDGFRDALKALATARASEGERTAGFLLQRADAIDASVEQARPLLKEAGQRYRDKLMTRIERLDIDAQPERLEQELALIAQRMDIDEELDRLGSHTTEVRSVLQRDEPVGRRLDFLIQELNREANTMSSKSQDEALTKIAVELKVVIEQMREQVQNLE